MINRIKDEMMKDVSELIEYDSKRLMTEEAWRRGFEIARKEFDK